MVNAYHSPDKKFKYDTVSVICSNQPLKGNINNSNQPFKEDTSDNSRFIELKGIYDRFTQLSLEKASIIVFKIHTDQKSSY